MHHNTHFGHLSIQGRAYLTTACEPMLSSQIMVAIFASTLVWTSAYTVLSLLFRAWHPETLQWWEIWRPVVLLDTWLWLMTFKPPGHPLFLLCFSFWLIKCLQCCYSTCPLLAIQMPLPHVLTNHINTFYFLDSEHVHNYDNNGTKLYAHRIGKVVYNNQNTERARTIGHSESYCRVLFPSAGVVISRVTFSLHSFTSLTTSSWDLYFTFTPFTASTQSFSLTPAACGEGGDMLWIIPHPIPRPLQDCLRIRHSGSTTETTSGNEVYHNLEVYTALMCHYFY